MAVVLVFGDWTAVETGSSVWIPVTAAAVGGTRVLVALHMFRFHQNHKVRFPLVVFGESRGEM